MKTRVLLVSHMPYMDPYGAASALRLSVNALMDPDDPGMTLYLAAPDASPMIAPFSRTLSVKIPMQLNFDGAPPRWQAAIWNIASSVRGRFNLPRNLTFSELVHQSDIVHLNSVSLAWLPHLLKVKPNQGPKFICHVRENVRGIPSRSREILGSLDGFICIDETVLNRLGNGGPIPARRPVLVLPDLVNSQTALNSPLARHIRRWAGDRWVAGVAGRIDPVKGFSFIAGVTRMRPDELCLVVAGRVTRNPLRFDSKIEAQRLLGDRNVKANGVLHLGEIPDLPGSGFYEGLDVLVRGEAYPAAGLTVYEALVRGVPVILPGKRADYRSNPLLEEAWDLISFASPRDGRSYMAAIENALAISEQVKRETAEELQLRQAERVRVHRESLLRFYQQILSERKF